MAKRIRPCIKCGSKDIKVWDCGYSSFNVGGAKCKKCDNSIKLEMCGCFPKNEIISEWNRQNPTIKTEIKRREEKIAELKDEINLHKIKIRELKKRDKK